MIESTLRVVVQPNRCVSSGLCVSRLPMVFTQDEDDGVVELLDEHPSESLLQELRNAAYACPARAIEVLVSTSRSEAANSDIAP